MSTALLVKKIIGKESLDIQIISRCPSCGYIRGIVGNDKEPINMKPEHVPLDTGEKCKIPVALCGRELCEDFTHYRANGCPFWGLTCTNGSGEFCLGPNAVNMCSFTKRGLCPICESGSKEVPLKNNGQGKKVCVYCQGKKEVSDVDLVTHT